MATRQKKHLRIPRIAKKLVRTGVGHPGMFASEFKQQVPIIKNSQEQSNN